MGFIGNVRAMGSIPLLFAAGCGNIPRVTLGPLTVGTSRWKSMTKGGVVKVHARLHTLWRCKVAHVQLMIIGCDEA